MQLQQFFEKTKVIDHLDLPKLQQLIANIKSSLQLYEKDFAKLGPALYNIADVIMKIKDVKNQYVSYYEDLISQVIRITIRNQFKVGSQSFILIFNNLSQYYKTANLDISLNYPIGRDRQLKQYYPKVGQQCDVVRPYITSTSVCGWTRCKICQIQNNKYLIKYENQPDQATSRDKAWFAPLGQRTQDYEWRRSLTIGSPCDAFLNRVWYRSTVAEVAQENGCKKVRITYRIFSENGDKSDSLGNKYFGLSSNEDQWLQIMSPRIQMYGKMVDRKLCYYSFNCQQLIFQDIYDIIFEKQYKQKPFYAIARIMGCKSTSFLKFINQFVQLGGIQKVINIVDNAEVEDQVPFRALSVIGTIVPFLPRMYLPESKLKELHGKILNYYQRIIKNLNYYKIQSCYFCFNMIGRRFYSLSQMHFYENELRKILIRQFLKMNMEKQMLALRYLNQLVNPKKPYTGDQKSMLDKFLKSQKIYSQIFNANMHEQIITRAGIVLQYMIKNQIISLQQFTGLWTIVPVSDTRGRAMIEKLLCQMSKTLPIDFVESLIKKILSLKQTELTIDNLNLLRQLKNRQIKNQSQINILQYLWNIITVKSINIKMNIQEQVQKVFKSFVNTLKDSQIRVKVLQSMTQKLQQCKKVRNQIQFLKDFIKSYPQKVQKNTQMIDQNVQRPPQTIKQVIIYVKRKGIYTQLINLLSRTKQEAIKKDILQFINFLFENDQQDVNQIIRSIYKIIGPTSNFLEWVNKLHQRSIDFIIQLLQTSSQFSVYQGLNSTGFQAIQGMILEINRLKKNLRIVLTYNFKNEKTSSVAVGTTTPLYPGPVTGDAGTNQACSTNKNQKMIGPQLPQIKKTIFILVSPLKLIGTKFLQNLLPTVKQTSVFNSIVAFIVQLVTNFDQSVQENVNQYITQYLQSLIQHIKSTVKSKTFNQKVRTKLQVIISLLIQIFAETQRHGIGELQPYFTKVEGQKILLNVNNLIDSQKQKKYKNSLPRFQIQCNQNITLWRLKQIASKYVNEEPQQINIIKYTDPMNDINNCKSLTQLLFYNKQDIKISRKGPEVLQKVSLFNEDKTDVAPQLMNIINNLFNSYKDQKLNGLTPKNFQRLSDQKWKSSFFMKPQILAKVFSQFDKQNKGYLNIQDFKNFFFEKSLKSQNAIWRLINSSGYKNNLKLDTKQVKKVNTQNLPRKILSNPQVYKLIFQILEDQTFKEVHVNFYKLLTFLQVDKTQIQQIEHQIYQIIQKQKSTYALCYSLQVVASQLSKFSHFYYQFWKNNGIQIINKRIKEILTQKSVYELDLITKNQIIASFTRILYLYAYEIFSIYKIARFTSQNRINYLDINQFSTKLSDNKQPNISPELQSETFKKLKECGPIQQNVKKIYETAHIIFNSVVKGYNNQKVDFLSRLTTQIVRLMVTLVCGNQKHGCFNPYDYLYGINNLSLNNRRSITILIYVYLFFSKQPNFEQIQAIINKIILQAPIQNKIQNINFYEFLKEVIVKYMSIMKVNKQKDEYFIGIGNNLLNKLFNQIQGQLRTDITSNKIILGILQTIQALIQKNSICHGLSWRVLQITEKCLFAYNIEQKISQIVISQQMLVKEKQIQHWKNYVICKTQNCRNVAYNIVVKMHKISPALEPNFVNNYIMPIILSIKPQVRLTTQKYLDVGLKNYGSTCYMNSMLQVLNSIKPFRNSLMKCQSQSQLVIQLKRLFAGLFFSERLDYAPEKILTSFVPPINPGIQQDTTQFLNLLFDQLQIGLSKTNYKRLLDQIFKGTNVAQMICHSCGYKKQNKQEFFCFGVQIEGKFDLYSALQGSHQGQIISDYLCDSCKNKGQTTKRNILSQIPNVLFIHLRRIVFNYDMFVNMKIHTRLQFPEVLNIQPYTKQGVQLREKLGLEYMKNLSHNQQQIKKFQQISQHGKQKDFYKLKLKGVIVHSGSADVGHYYSILPFQDNWRKYDDSRISFFAPSGFQSTCYGGVFTAQQWGSGSSVNAYVLVYQKLVKDSIKIQQDQKQVQLIYDQIKTYNSPGDYIQFWLDNHYFMLENHLMNPNMGKGFIAFLQKIITDSPKQINKIQIISQIVQKVSFYSGLVGQLIKIVNDNSNEITPQIFQTYIVKDKVKTFKLLFHNEKQVRQFMANYMYLVLNQCFIKGQQQTRQKILAYINQLMGMLTTQIARNWLRVDGFFFLLNRLVYSSTENITLWNFFLDKRLISLLIDYVLQKQSPVRILQKSYSLGTKAHPMDCYSCISIINFYLKFSYGFTGKNYEVPSPPEHLMFHLNDNQITCLSYIQFYRKILKQRQNLYQFASIIQRLSIMNIEFSKSIIQVILQTINSITDPKDEIQDLSYVCLQLLKIRDDYWINRAELLLGFSSPFILNNNVMSTFDQQRYVYSSSLYDIFPIESLLSYSYLYRLKNTLACFHLIKAIVQGCSVSDIAIKFIARLPSPSYLFSSYIHWVQNFVQTFASYATNDNAVRQRLQLEAKDLMKYIEDVKTFVKDNPEVDYYKYVITGQVFDKKQIECFQKDGIQIKVFEYQTYCHSSKPVNSTGENKEFSPYLQSYRLTKKVKNQSNILKFIKKPAIAVVLKLQSNQQQEKELKQLFSQKAKDPIIPIVSTSTQIQAQSSKIQGNKQSQLKISEQSKQNKEEQVVEQQIQLQGVYTCNYYRQIQVSNKKKDKKFVKVLFHTEQNPNFIIPKQMYYKIFAKGNQNLWISKQDPQKDWGNLQIKLVVDDYVKEKHEKKEIKTWWFKTYGSKEDLENLFDMEINRIENEVPSSQAPAVPSNQQGAQEEIDDYVSCPICTFNNSASSINCSMCQSPLK